MRSRVDQRLHPSAVPRSAPPPRTFHEFTAARPVASGRSSPPARLGARRGARSRSRSPSRAAPPHLALNCPVGCCAQPTTSAGTCCARPAGSVTSAPMATLRSYTFLDSLQPQVAATSARRAGLLPVPASLLCSWRRSACDPRPHGVALRRPTRSRTPRRRARLGCSSCTRRPGEVTGRRRDPRAMGNR